MFYHFYQDSLIELSPVYAILVHLKETQGANVVPSSHQPAQDSYEGLFVVVLPHSIDLYLIISFLGVHHDKSDFFSFHVAYFIFIL